MSVMLGIYGVIAAVVILCLVTNPGLTLICLGILALGGTHS